MRPARAALTRPARGASFRLIVTASPVSLGGQPYRTVREDISIDHQEAAAGGLTPRVRRRDTPGMTNDDALDRIFPTARTHRAFLAPPRPATPAPPRAAL